MRTRALQGVLAGGAAALAAAAAIAAAAPAQAASAGSLDPSFGTGGVVTVPAGFGPGTMLTQSNGTILVEGGLTNATTGDSEFAVLSYNSNGTLNTSFGTDGLAVASFSGASAAPSGAFVEPDGGIVVVGEEVVPGDAEDAAVAEFNANGTLDTSFGSGGEVRTSLSGDVGLDTVLVEPDGDILAGGSLAGAPKAAYQNVLIRYTPSGALDTSFGNGGSVAQQVAGSNSIVALGEDSAGDIFVQNDDPQAGDTIGGGIGITIGEYSPAGVPDSTVTFPSSDTITVSSTNGFQPNGTYAGGQMVQVDVGSKTTYDVQVLLDSLPAGAASGSFSNAPFAYASGDAANTITGSPFVGSNGDVAVDGSTCATFRHGVCQNGNPCLALLTPTGSLDSAFGTDGVITIPVSSSGSTDIESPTIQPDGNILVPMVNFTTNAQGITTTTATIDRFLG